jgi:uncharacterized lipoprotein YbaY
MSSRWVRTSLVVLGAVAVGLVIAGRRLQQEADTSAPGERPDPFRNNEASNALRRYLSAMYSQGDDAAEIYRGALEPLRSNPEGVVAEIANAEPMLKETDYPSRWTLIFAASELRHPAALAYLRTVALSRIPTERSSDPHSFSTVTEETILRTTAVEGIGHLARENNQEATDALFQCLARPSLSIRRAAVQQLLQIPGGHQYRERIAAALPEDQHFLLNLRRMDVRDVPQIRNPEQLLARTPHTNFPPPLDHRPSEVSTAYVAAGKNPPPTLRR